MPPIELDIPEPLRRDIETTAASQGVTVADFLIAPATQEVIGNFGKDKYGQQLFVPDAGKQDADVGG